ncbi:MAG: GNAT family N-acetyltransferase [bacterium]|nr:GNAT family N-acetyltransferase [bacterium]
MTKYRYHHLGLPTDEPKEGEHYLETLKLYHTNFDQNPYGIEWMRYEAGSSIPEIVQKLPHIAFQVDDLDAALEGKEILIKPNAPSDGVRVGFIMYNGAPVEFLEYDETLLVKDFPILETPDLLLRPFKAGDISKLVKLYAKSKPFPDSDTAGEHIATPRQARKWIQDVCRNFNREGVPLWAISIRENREALLEGYIGFNTYSEFHQRAEIVCFPGLNLPQGILLEAMGKILEYAFVKMGLHSVSAVVNPSDTASVRLLEEFNFQKEAHYRESRCYKGKYYDSAVYALLKKDFRD